MPTLLKKTKIVATIGPVTENAKILTELALSGMNVMRLNFSHGDFAEHQKRVDLWKAVAKKTNLTLAILQDLGGPKIRIGNFSTESIILKAGNKFTLTTNKIIGDDKKVFVNYPKLPKEVKAGNIILLEDGKKSLQVLKVSGKEIECKILVGGEIKGRRGVNVPGANLSISSITEKDRADIAFGIKNKVDFIALSFVRRAEDILELKRMLKNKSNASVIAKIETQEAVENIDDIIKVADGIMVARGDLAIETPAEKVPSVQKMIIKKCNDAGKPVITATQMLESMIENTVPTRAEVSDIANAILDGTDAIMLSGESTLGKYPLEAVKIMTKVALEVEKNYPEREALNGHRKGQVDITDSVTGSVVNTAHDVGAKFIFALTETGFTARMISRYKPSPMIITLSPNEEALRKIALSFGSLPFKINRFKTLGEALQVVRKFCLDKKMAKKGDRVVIAAGAPFNKKTQSTNMILVEEI